MVTVVVQRPRVQCIPFLLPYIVTNYIMFYDNDYFNYHNKILFFVIILVCTNGAKKYYLILPRGAPAWLAQVTMFRKRLKAKASRCLFPKHSTHYAVIFFQLNFVYNIYDNVPFLYIVQCL